MSPQARKRFGQHFLTDSFVLAQIAAAVSVQAGDSLFEIGPGRGALTQQLYHSEERYRAVEIDRDLIAGLGAQFPAMELINADVLAAPMATLLADGPWRVVGNLPYNISSPLLARLFEHWEHIVDIHVMLQKEVAQRLAAAPGSKAYGRLTVGCQLRAEVSLLFAVPPESFTPAPAVDSAVVRLTPLPAAQQLEPAVHSVLDQALRLAFQQRRKRIANALKPLAPDFSSLAIDPAQRADQISVEDYVQLAHWLLRERTELVQPCQQ